MGDAKTVRAALAGCAYVSAALFQCGQARAADPTDVTAWRATLLPEPTDPPPSADAAPQDNTSKFQVTAREWISAMSKLEAHNNSVSTTQMYLYGGSLAYVPAWESGVTFLLTAYYGVSIGYSNFQDYNSVGSSNLQRLDVEGITKIPIGTTPAYAALGIRFIDFKRNDTATARGYYIDANSTIQPFTVPYTRLTNYRYFLGELGVGTVTALDEMSKHRMFGGAMFVGGAYNTGQDFSFFGNSPAYGLDLTSGPRLTPVVGMDTHFGYAYSPWPSITLSMRYRAFVMADVYDGLRFSNRGIVWPIDYSHYSLVHGPEFNLAYQF
jgi:hypothetical protein